MTVTLREEAFDPWAALQSYQEKTLGQRGKYGAMVSFIGTMRDFNEGAEVQTMTLESYPAMAEKYLHKITAEARSRWEIVDSLIIHRTGLLRPAEPIVLIAVWAAHREAAFEACRYLIEELKAKAPFWKKESLAGGDRWVGQPTPAGDVAASRRARSGEDRP